MEDKAKAGGILIGLGVLLAYLIYKYRKTPQPYTSVSLNGVPVSSGPATVSPSASADTVLARAMGPAIYMADPTSSTGYSWTAPVGAHLEQSSDGRWWVVSNNTPAQTRGSSGPYTYGPYPQSVEAVRPAPGRTYDASGPYGGVSSGVANFPPVARGPSGSQDPNFNPGDAIIGPIIGVSPTGTPYVVPTSGIGATSYNPLDGSGGVVDTPVVLPPGEYVA